MLQSILDLELKLWNYIKEVEELAQYFSDINDDKYPESPFFAYYYWILNWGKKILRFQKESHYR